MPFRAHLHTVNRHRRLVRHYCFKLGLVWQGLTHDLSKYSPTEFWRGVKYYQGWRSPNDQERLENGVSLAWLHHKGRNRHHFEYWTDYNPKTKKVSPVKMPFCFVAEMFCDRLAASKIYQGKAYNPGHPLSYFLRGKATRFIHPETSAELEKMLNLLAEQGEDAVFSYIRQKLKAGAEY